MRSMQIPSESVPSGGGRSKVAKPVPGVGVSVGEHTQGGPCTCARPGLVCVVQVGLAVVPDARAVGTVECRGVRADLLDLFDDPVLGLYRRRMDFFWSKAFGIARKNVAVQANRELCAEA